MEQEKASLGDPFISGVREKDFKKKKEELRELAKKIAHISTLPIQEKTMKAWKALNGLKPERPMFMVDQLPWGELSGGEFIKMEPHRCILDHFKHQLMQTLFRWENCQDDRVVTDIIYVPKAIEKSGFGMNIDATTIHGRPGTVNSYMYKAIIETDEDIEKIQTPVVSENKDATRERISVANDIFFGILRVSPQGADNYGHVWDMISTWRGVENCMFDIADRPEFVHKILDKMFGIFHHVMDEYERLGLIDVGQPSIHCTGAFSDELPGFAGESEAELEKFRYSGKNVWTYGAAQLFSMVSPDVHDEFEIAYQSKWFGRFGLGYYGCCEPLDRKIDIIAKLPNVRKISVSPWADMERSSSAMNGRFVFSRKPNPAFLATDSAWDEEIIRDDLISACKISEKYNNPCELILKDVSTLGNVPERLTKWTKIAAEVCGR